jgi:hypothetical protein
VGKVSTYGKFPALQSAYELFTLFHSCTDRLLRLRLSSCDRDLDMRSMVGEGQCAPVQCCRLPRRRLPNQADQRIAWHNWLYASEQCVV